MKPWTTLASTKVFECKYFDIVKDTIVRPTGEINNYYTVTREPSVFIIPITYDRKIYFIKQFRYPTKTYSWELPAGSTDGEEPLAAAKRELQEETGLVASGWYKYGTLLLAPGLSNNIATIFSAWSLTQTNSNKQQEEGIIDAQAFSITEIKDKIKSGEIADGPTLAVLSKILVNV